MVQTLKSDDNELLELVAVLRAVDPNVRIAAAEIVDHAVFAADLQWRQLELRQCVTCLETDVPLEGGGLECGDPNNSHFTCSDCLERMVCAHAEEDVATLKRRDSKIPCPGTRPPGAPSFFSSFFSSDGDVAQRVPVAVFDKHIAARTKVLEEQIARELQAGMEQQMKAELKQLLAMDEQGRKVGAKAAEIRDSILTLQCPRDGQVFVDFEGCLSLACSRCQCVFCGWCLADCGVDAHDHIEQCAVKPTALLNDPHFALDRALAAAPAKAGRSRARNSGRCGPSERGAGASNGLGQPRHPACQRSWTGGRRRRAARSST